jgi:L-cysteine S-thiosulfotransferase
MARRRCRSVMRPWLRTCVGIGLAVGTTVTAAQDNTLQEIERYRLMLQDGNPAELMVARGEGLWKEKRGPKNATLEQCDLGLGPGVVKGAYARLPRYFADTDQVQDFEARLVHCMVRLQGFDRSALTKEPYSGAG